jgi:hypothetical protein
MHDFSPRNTWESLNYEEEIMGQKQIGNTMHIPEHNVGHAGGRTRWAEEVLRSVRVRGGGRGGSKE